MNLIAILICLTSPEVMRSLPEPTVTACLEGASSTSTAESTAARIFERIGVRLQWRSGARDCPDNGIHVILTTNTSADVLPGALAYTTPYGEATVRVFYDRVTDGAMYHRRLMSSLLGHVLAHEIGHVLQGVNRHSSKGVMKAKWLSRDIFDMALRPLEFSPMDARLILLGLQARERDALRSASGRSIPTL